MSHEVLGIPSIDEEQLTLKDSAAQSYTVSKTSLRLRRHPTMTHNVTALLYLQHRMVPQITIPEISLKVQKFTPWLFKA
jgi:hypothetical protein